MKKRNMAPFTGPQRMKKVLRRVILMMYINQSILPLCQRYKNLLEKVRVGLMIQL